MIYLERLKYLESKIKCLLLGHVIEYGYNYEKALMIQRCKRCKKIIGKAQTYMEKVK